ncbi:hypothetical protein [Ignavibacterium sp.]|uniref:hypothetical protein n=1 Tax=Ignavibacterium sp. TaxID=2651167 RepID=UPI00307DAB9A
MKRIILETDSKKDLLLITELAERLKIKYKIEPFKVKVSKKEYNLFLDKGVDISNFGNPSRWQRKVRKDRKII